MVERWSYGENFATYYGACTPIDCSYTLVRYNSFTYVLTLLIGLQGGLIVALRLLAPFLVTMGHRLNNHINMWKQSRVQPQLGMRVIIHKN